jgi:ABC-type transport system substrate-binding protein
MKKALTLMLTVLLMLGFAATIGNAAAINGPKADTLLIKIYASDVAEFAAFEAGDIDIIDWSLDPAKVDQYSQSPDNASIVLAFYEEYGMFEFDVNNNLTIPSAPGVVSPTSDPWFRVALQYLVDKDDIETNILQGYGVRIDTVVPPLLGAWSNPNVNHYGYDQTTAEAILDANGYTMGTTWRINPDTGVDMVPLLFYMRADDALRRTPAGLAMAANMEAAGIPVNELVVDRTVCYDEVMVYNDFHLYTGGWNLGRDPDHLYFLYHEDMYWGAWSLNYNQIRDTLHNTYSYNVYAAPDLTFAMTNAHLDQERLMNRPDDTSPGIAALIPLWSTAGYNAYRHPMVHAVNAAGYGTTNWWSFLKGRFMSSETGGTIRWGFKSDVQALNPLYSSWVWDWYVLDKCYDGLLNVNPYDTAIDMVWHASSYTDLTWAGPHANDTLSLINFVLNENLTFHDGTPLTVEDVKFTIEYIQSFTDCWLYANVADVYNVTIDAVSRTIDVRMSVLSVWARHWIQGLPILPKHIWEPITNATGFQPEATLTGSGPWNFTEYSAGDHVTLTAFRDYFMPTHPSPDINIDAIVDIFDVIGVAASFGKQRGEAGFDIRADIVATWDLVDIFDMILVAAAFGDTWVPS